MSGQDWCNGKRGFCQHVVLCDKCEHFNGKGLVELSESLLAYIRELEARVAELEKVKKERDAAIADMEKLQGCICQACKHYYQPDPTAMKWSCRVLGEYWADICDHDGELVECSNFEWRGVQEDG